MPNLFVGSAPDAGQAKELSRRGITAVVDLRAEVENEGFWPNDVIVRRMPIIDREVPEAADLIDLARWVVEAIGRGDVVLIHCHAGQGRAATAGCAVLIELGYELPDAYRVLRTARPVVSPTEPQITLLRELDEARRPAAS